MPRKVRPTAPPTVSPSERFLTARDLNGSRRVNAESDHRQENVGKGLARANLGDFTMFGTANRRSVDRGVLTDPHQPERLHFFMIRRSREIALHVNRLRSTSHQRQQTNRQQILHTLNPTMLPLIFAKVILKLKSDPSDPYFGRACKRKPLLNWKPAWPLIWEARGPAPK